MRTVLTLKIMGGVFDQRADLENTQFLSKRKSLLLGPSLSAGCHLLGVQFMKAGLELLEHNRK
jgi:hypothetical protein